MLAGIINYNLKHQAFQLSPKSARDAHQSHSIHSPEYLIVVVPNNFNLDCQQDLSLLVKVYALKSSQLFHKTLLITVPLSLSRVETREKVVGLCSSKRCLFGRCLKSFQCKLISHIVQEDNFFFLSSSLHFHHRHRERGY